jgi:hypothetical protein
METPRLQPKQLEFTMEIVCHRPVQNIVLVLSPAYTISQVNLGNNQRMHRVLRDNSEGSMRNRSQIIHMMRSPNLTDNSRGFTVRGTQIRTMMLHMLNFRSKT